MRRQRRISHQLSQDSDGNEIMLVRFWVEGQVPHDSNAEQDVYWWDTVKAWIGPLIWEDSTKPGSYQPLPTRPSPPVSAPPVPTPPPQPQSWGNWVASGLGSVFGGLVPKLATGQDGHPTTGGVGMFKRARKPSLGEYSTGEVTAELKKVSQAIVTKCILSKGLSKQLTSDRDHSCRIRRPVISCINSFTCPYLVRETRRLSIVLSTLFRPLSLTPVANSILRRRPASKRLSRGYPYQRRRGADEGHGPVAVLAQKDLCRCLTTFSEELSLWPSMVS